MNRSTASQLLHPQSLAEHAGLTLREDGIIGPLSFLNPTRARYDFGSDRASKTEGADDSGITLRPSRAQYEWRSRDHRKGKFQKLSSRAAIKNTSNIGLLISRPGRHILVLPRDEAPPLSASLRKIGHGIFRMATVWAVWDVSWWIGVCFTFGSALFIVCGFFYWLPLVDSSTKFSGEGVYGGGFTSFFGATLFEAGGLLLIVEATNEKQSGCFGWALEQEFTSSSPSKACKSAKTSYRRSANATTKYIQSLPNPSMSCRYYPHPDSCTHSHNVGFRGSRVLLEASGRRWEWWPTWRELTTHYFHEIGFIGSFVMAVGATIFWITGLLTLPGIYNHLSQGVLDGLYWLTYLVGGIFFTAASVCYVLETQEKWWKPAPRSIGWWIGVWDGAGSVGWVIAASFGYCSASWCAYQSNLTLLWASSSFFISSLLLWYEALDKYPIVTDRKDSSS